MAPSKRSNLTHQTPSPSLSKKDTSVLRAWPGQPPGPCSIPELFNRKEKARGKRSAARDPILPNSKVALSPAPITGHTEKQALRAAHSLGPAQPSCSHSSQRCCQPSARSSDFSRQLRAVQSDKWEPEDLSSNPGWLSCQGGWATGGFQTRSHNPLPRRFSQRLYSPLEDVSGCHNVGGGGYWWSLGETRM